MEFATFLSNLSKDERESFAELAGTSPAMLAHVARRRKTIGLGLADVFVALTGNAVGLDQLPLTERATQQRHVREIAGSAVLRYQKIQQLIGAAAR